MFKSPVADLEEIRPLEDEDIVHFRRVRVSKNKVEELRKFIKKQVQAQRQKVDNFDSVVTRYMKKHYYIPLLLTDNEEVAYISHVIKTKSERNFIKNI